MFPGWKWKWTLAPSQESPRQISEEITIFQHDKNLNMELKFMKKLKWYLTPGQLWMFPGTPSGSRQMCGTCPTLSCQSFRLLAWPPPLPGSPLPPFSPSPPVWGIVGFLDPQQCQPAQSLDSTWGHSKARWSTHLCARTRALSRAKIFKLNTCTDSKWWSWVSTWSTRAHMLLLRWSIPVR